MRFNFNLSLSILLFILLSIIIKGKKLKKVIIPEDLRRDLIKKYQELEKVNKGLSNRLTQIDNTLLSIMVERNVKNQYGDSYKCVGLQGILFQVLHKAARLKNTVTDGNDFKWNQKALIDTCKRDGKIDLDNGIASHLVDLINYCKLALVEILDSEPK